MKLFIWEGHGISTGYHDDGTLVVLAESAEQARTVARTEKLTEALRQRDWNKRRDALERRLSRNPTISNAGYTAGRHWSNTVEGKTLLAEMNDWPKLQSWDGSKKALEREPDRIVEIDVPCVVSFNGGGYD